MEIKSKYRNEIKILKWNQNIEMKSKYRNEIDTSTDAYKHEECFLSTEASNYCQNESTTKVQLFLPESIWLNNYLSKLKIQ